jgi:hypothetical protein
MIHSALMYVWKMAVLSLLKQGINNRAAMPGFLAGSNYEY